MQATLLTQEPHNSQLPIRSLPYQHKRSLTPCLRSSNPCTVETLHPALPTPAETCIPQLNNAFPSHRVLIVHIISLIFFAYQRASPPLTAILANEL